MMTEQDLFASLDRAGYEQDGDGYDFIRVKDGERLHFDTLIRVCQRKGKERLK